MTPNLYILPLADTPTVITSGTSTQDAWPGESCNFTCLGHGLPPPSMNWFRGGQYISNNRDYTIHTERADTVTSTLQVGGARRGPCT